MSAAKQMTRKRKSVAKGDVFVAVERTARAESDDIHALDDTSAFVDLTVDAAGKPRPKQSWSSVTLRILSGAFLLGSFALIVWAGHLLCALLTLVIQVMVFREIMYLGVAEKHEDRIPLFRTMHWLFLASAMVLMYGERALLILNDAVLFKLGFGDIVLGILAMQDFLYFAVYCTAFVAFTLSLRKGWYLVQLKYFARAHITLLLIVVTGALGLKNLFAGLIWYLLPTMIVVVNDIAAFACGKNFGRTPLIALSPKKTWEGFIGGFVLTMIFSVAAARFMLAFDYFVCPKFDFSDSLFGVSSCIRSEVFRPRVVSLPYAQALNLPWQTVVWYPFMNHSLVLGLFGSLLAPFGGFFASGVKRAFKAKDFGVTFPGHGGWADRFDCQFIMHPFVYVYRISFVVTMTPVALILKRIAMLSPEDQQAVASGLTALLRK